MGIFRFLRTLLSIKKSYNIIPEADEKIAVHSSSTSPSCSEKDCAVSDAYSVEDETQNFSDGGNVIDSQQMITSSKQVETRLIIQPVDGIRDRILQACSAGDIQDLNDIFSKLAITAPLPEIIYTDGRQPLSSEPPSTSQMLHVSVRDQQESILKYLLEIFPLAQIDGSVCDEALSHRNIAIWTQLLEHDRCFINKEIDLMERTIFSLACWSMKPELPILMLDYGANPSVNGSLCMSVLGLVLAEQPIELIQKLLEKGAQPEGHLIQAVRCGRSDVV